jgi:hypothetical protein
MKQKTNKQKVRTTFPTEPQLSFNEWCRAFNVSSQYISQKLYDMYHRPETENKVFANIIKKHL